MHDKERHKIEYIVLGLLLCLYLGLFIYFRFDKGVLLLLSGLISITYSLWGIIHHVLESRLTNLIALEYILYGFFVFSLLFVVLSF
jgi:hypothetical protein